MATENSIVFQLNPRAKEFIPSNNYFYNGVLTPQYFTTIPPLFYHHSTPLPTIFQSNGFFYYPRNYGLGQRKYNSRSRRAYQMECKKRTVYVCNLDQQVTENYLSYIFSFFGGIVDCRICGDPNSASRFGFVEFCKEESAKVALGLNGTLIGHYYVRVLPSRTAIMPVNPSYLPKSIEEVAMCARTIYCTNIPKEIDETGLQRFFEAYCGQVSRIRVLADNIHPTSIAFIEFYSVQSAIVALGCSGLVLGSLPIRVNPSKTPVRLREARADDN